ncbi:hypothetical protein [Granulicella arctica]|uniref:hypothetical protein n=1 Tax=Granulicella arctica TaxID=940613 RepID=UPI0021E005FB|nr:hypothetical protein [Granulicella arctica]
MSTRRSVALSLPVFLFACLILAANVRAQDAVTFQFDEASSHPFVVLRFELEPKAGDGLTQARRVSTTQKNYRLTPFDISNPVLQASDSSSLVPATELARQVTAAQCFGVGAQAAP